MNFQKFDIFEDILVCWHQRNFLTISSLFSDLLVLGHFSDNLVLRKQKIWNFEKFSEISVRDQTFRSQSGQSHWNFNSETPEKSRGVSSKTGGQNGRKIELWLTAHFNLVYFNRDLGYLIVTSYVKTDFLARNIQWIQMVYSMLGHMNYITVHFGQFSCEFSL